MFDDLHVGIRSPKDIKTWEEVMQGEESFTWGDFSREDAEKAGINKEMFKYILDIDVLPNRDQTRYEEWFSQLGYTPNRDNAIKVKQMLSGYLIHEASSASNLIDSLYRGIKAAGKREAPSNEAEKESDEDPRRQGEQMESNHELEHEKN